MCVRVCVHSDGRESHVVTKKFEVKPNATVVNSQNDDTIDFSRAVSVSEVKSWDSFVNIIHSKCGCCLLLLRLLCICVSYFSLGYPVHDVQRWGYAFDYCRLLLCCLLMHLKWNDRFCFWFQWWAGLSQLHRLRLRTWNDRSWLIMEICIVSVLSSLITCFVELVKFKVLVFLFKCLYSFCRNLQ